MGKSDVLAGLIAILLLVSVAGGIMCAITYIQNITQPGKTYDVTVTVSSVELSEHLYIHTNVWCDQFLSTGDYGREALVYCLIGHHHNITIGQVYRIRFTNKMLFNWWKGGYFIAGKVIEIKQVN